MNLKIIVITGITACIISSLATIALLRNSDEKDSQPTLIASPLIPSDAEKLDKNESKQLVKLLLEEVGQLHAKISKLEQQFSANALKQSLQASSEPETVKVPISSEEAVNRREALVKTHKDIFENNLRQEEKDQNWSENAQAKLSSIYSAATDKGVRFIGADCRSTICKVNMALDHPGKPGEIQLRRLMDGPAPWQGPRFMQMDKRTGEVVMYMMRENYALPDLPSESTIQ